MSNVRKRYTGVCKSYEPCKPHNDKLNKWFHGTIAKYVRLKIMRDDTTSLVPRERALNTVYIFSSTRFISFWHLD